MLGKIVDRLPLWFSVHRLRAVVANAANTSGSFLSERSNTSSTDLQGSGDFGGCRFLGAVSHALQAGPAIHSLRLPICARISRIRRFDFADSSGSVRLSRWLCLSSPFGRRLRPCGRWVSRQFRSRRCCGGRYALCFRRCSR